MMRFNYSLWFIPNYLICSNKAGIKIPERAGTKARNGRMTRILIDKTINCFLEVLIILPEMTAIVFLLPFF